jgi:hypothetical protein
MDFAGELSPEQFWAHTDALYDQVRAAAHLLPLYGVAGWAGLIMIGDWEWYNDDLSRAGLSYGDPLGGPLGGTCIAVTTCADEESVPQAGPFGPVRLPPTGPGPEISLDGRPVPVDSWREVDSWHAVATLGDHLVHIEVGGPAPDRIDLVRVTDVEPYLAGSRAYLHAARGEG